MRPERFDATLGLLDGGPLDEAGDRVVDAVPATKRRRPRGWGEWLGWSATSAPVALLLVTGIGLGPQGLSVLSPGVLSLIDPVVPVALAALGVLVGLGVSPRGSGDWRAMAAASLDAAVTLTLVAAGVALLAPVAGVSLGQSAGTLALIAGICAATSLTLPTGNPLEPRSTTASVAETGVLLPIVAGGIGVAWLQSGSPMTGLALVVQAAGITVTLAAAAWLLLSRVASETEERVFAIAALLLVGGVADALSLSALLGGLVAGVFWRFAGRRPRDTISRDVLFVQHPLVALVLLSAGARVEPTWAALVFGMNYLALRVAGKRLGGWLARRVLGPRAPASLGRELVAPGVFGVAFALNAAAILGADASVVVTAVVIGTIGSEFVLLWSPSRSDRS
jgi:hypothetical protein